MVAAMLLRQRSPTLALTEAHPKALLWMLGEATLTRQQDAVTMQTLARYFDIGALTMPTDHERDAAFGALTAWAMGHRADSWEDIRGLDADAVSPVAAPLGYWVPKRSA